MFIGIDLGSRTIKLAVVEEGKMMASAIAESGFDPASQALAMLAPYGRPRRLVATGYGRHLARQHFADGVITEIKAHALGVRHHFPECRCIVDVGGQDAKVIALDASGRVSNFQMNDKCAAGTGRFLEIMALTLGFSLSEFGGAALAAGGETVLNSMCTVFAESEVISLKNQGMPADRIARGVHLAVINRLAAMLGRLGCDGTLVFTGGVAKNPAMVALLGERLGEGIRLLVPDAPDLAGALGAALEAARSAEAR